jgi:Yip1 domain
MTESPGIELLTVPPLTQGQRLVDTFSAPSKTFTDILRDQSWWLPFLLGVLVGYGYLFAIQKQVGWDTVAQNVIRQDPKASERLANSPPESRAQALKVTQMIVQSTFYATPLLALLISAIGSLVLWGTINLLFGGHATFGRVFAVWMYGTLPLILKSILAIITLFAGLDKEAFNLNNPVGTNPGYFLPIESSQWLLKFATSFDILWIWSMVLLGIGLAIVAKVKRSSGLTAVFGWWILILVVRVGYAAIAS